MIVEPKIKGFICTTAHPLGCHQDVANQIEFVRGQDAIKGGPAKVLVIGASGGYGLASRITAAYGCGADTLGVFLEKPAERNRTASAGWYRAAAFESLVADLGPKSASINGDAFSDEIKAQTASVIRQQFGQVDLVVYSLASPVRRMPGTGELVRSVLKPIGQDFRGMTIDVRSGELREISAEPATDDEIADTVKVMGGEDWQLWIDALSSSGCLADGVQTITYTYLGSEVTWPIYHHGTIGKAKEDLDRVAAALSGTLAARGGSASVAVMKGLLTQASSAIPGMPLYLSLLFRAMKDQGVHEGCIEQTLRLFRDRLFAPDDVKFAADGRIHMDDLEMDDAVQAYVRSHWSKVNNENLQDLTDFNGYREGFLNLYGFGFSGIDYQQEVDPMVELT